VSCFSYSRQLLVRLFCLISVRTTNVQMYRIISSTCCTTIAAVCEYSLCEEVSYVSFSTRFDAKNLTELSAFTLEKVGICSGKVGEFALEKFGGIYSGKLVLEMAILYRAPKLILILPPGSRAPWASLAVPSN